MRLLIYPSLTLQAEDWTFHSIGRMHFVSYHDL